MRRVAITGLGVVSALGSRVEPFWQALVAGKSGTRRVTLIDTSRLNDPVAAEVPDFDPALRVPEDRLPFADRFAQFALAAAGEALADADGAIDSSGSDRAGIALGTGAGGVNTEDHSYRRLYEFGDKRLHPFSIPRIMYNAASAQVSMQYGLRGPSLCFSTACASSTHAIGEAAEMIRAGRADVMLAGGSDAPVMLGLFKIWEAMRVLAPAGADPARACRPFSADRQGFVLGEGAGVVVLEDWDHAVRRGARIHAELAGYGTTSDAGHITHLGIDQPVRAIEMAVSQAGIPKEAVGYVNAHGTATRVNDAAETTILRCAFGAHATALAVSSTKSMHGHVMGATGAIELIATVLAVERGVLPPTANYAQPDPECDLDCVPNVARPCRVEAAISSSFAFGGHNAVLLVRHSDAD